MIAPQPKIDQPPGRPGSGSIRPKPIAVHAKLSPLPTVMAKTAPTRTTNPLPNARSDQRPYSATPTRGGSTRGRDTTPPTQTHPYTAVPITPPPPTTYPHTTYHHYPYCTHRVPPRTTHSRPRLKQPHGHTPSQGSVGSRCYILLLPTTTTYYYYYVHTYVHTHHLLHSYIPIAIHTPHLYLPLPLLQPTTHLPTYHLCLYTYYSTLDVRTTYYLPPRQS